MKGTLRKFDPRRGFGFVRADNGQEVFLHSREIVDGTRLRPGLRLEFDVEDAPDGRGPVAINVSSTGQDGARRDVRPEVGTRRGWIRKFNGSFGFVKPEDGADSLFFRASCSQLGNDKSVCGGLPVMFETAQGRDGRLEAVNLRRIVPEHQSKEQETECRQAK